ncbi:polyphenol oxidase, chloroplastic-like [Alnus glutinosa]|uniref:polyphenol oxidase, chloroplastic-like n=1 Tax=Alnus glutinosa TaxID=3517 RepID=UPI002D76576D|nr:polyphenol oxidase, chloroplastic-like [Alnus glutinosa]
MASFCTQPIFTTTQTVAGTTSTFPSFSFSSFHPKNHQISKSGKRNQRQLVPRVLACKATKGDQNLTSGSKDGQPPQGKFDRRDVLIGLGGLYGAASLPNDPAALAAPVSAPDITKCSPATITEGSQTSTINCCPTGSTTITDFKIPPNPPLRVRPVAHLANKDYIAKYNKALQLMKALPDDGPRSFSQQASVHCAYCNGAYDQVGYPDLEYQVHDSWLFFPFHRWYLYFYEKILGKLIGDPTFAMPYWNWDSPAGMQIPAMFVDSTSQLYDVYRNANHLPPTLINLDYGGTDDSTTTPADQISSNLNVMYSQMVSSSKNAQLFHGFAYRAGGAADPGAGSLELRPHNNVHGWCGDPNHNSEDMGNLYSSGRDPLFYAHHSNVDRMWTIWKTLGGKRQDFTDPDWLNASFIFYDENAQPVRVYVKDCLETNTLGYAYQDVEIPWLKTKRTPRKSKNVKKVATLFPSERGGVALAAASSASLAFPVVLDKVISTVVARPSKSRSKRQKEEEEEVLVIEGIELEKAAVVKFDVYINDDVDTPSGPDKTEFAGSFVHVPHKQAHAKKKKTALRVGITDLLDDLGVDGDDDVVVTLVPRQGKGLVSIGGIKIELLS